jgi:hypothetical protein
MIAQLPTIGEQALDFARDFGGLSNAVVGFDIVQTLLFISAIGTHRGALASAVKDNWRTTIIIVCLAQGVYLALVAFFTTSQNRILQEYTLPTHLLSSLTILSVGRYAIVILLGMVTLMVCWTMKTAVISPE